MYSHLHRWKRSRPNRMDKSDRIRAKTNGHCAYCGKWISKKEQTRDHFVPRCKGGESTVENLYTCCPSCNRNKGSMDIEQFRDLFFGDRLFYFEEIR